MRLIFTGFDSMVLIIALMACVNPATDDREADGDEFSDWNKVFLDPGDDLHQAVLDAVPSTVITLAEGTFTLEGHGSWDYGVLIQDKAGLVIQGQGKDRTLISLPADLDFGFYLHNNISDFTLRNLGIAGTLPLQTNTHAVGNYTGPGYTTNVRRITFTDLRIRDVAVGLSLATHHEGSVYEGVLVTRNIISDTVGTESGWGYGIHTHNPSNVVITRNFVRNSTRHGIYFGRAAPGSNISITHNLVYDHDRLSDPNALLVASALVCARSSDVRLAFNTVLNSHLYSMSVEPDEDFGWPNEEIALVGNQILGAKVGGLWVRTGNTHAALGNTVIQRVENPFWSDYGIELENGSQLQVPDGRWEDQDMVFDHITSLDNTVFILRNGILDRLSPFRSEDALDWGYTASNLGLRDPRYLIAGYNHAGERILYAGLAGGGCVAVDPSTLTAIGGEDPLDDVLVMETAAEAGPWIADGSTEYTLDVILDTTGLSRDEFFLAEWDLKVPSGLTIVRAELPVEASDYFAGHVMADNCDMVDAQVDADGCATENVRLVHDAFLAPSGRRGLLGRYLLTVDPDCLPGTKVPELLNCATATNGIAVYGAHNGLTVRNAGIDIAQLAR